MFDFWWIILYAAIFVVILLKLRSVLGQRTGRERPPYDPFSARDTAARDSIRPAANSDRPPATDNVVSLPGRTAAEAAPSRSSRRPRWRTVGRPNAAPAPQSRPALDAIAREDKSFDGKHFIAGARAAYEMIVTAYAEGDRRTLKISCRATSVTVSETAIRDREAKGETSESRFVSIDKSDLTDAELRGKTAQVTIRFVSQLVSVTRDRNGAVIDGNPDKVTDVTDVWTFARDLSSRDPNWKLVATEAGQ